MTNAWRGFRDLLPRQRLIIAVVDTHNADGTSTLTTLDGGTIRARGQSVSIGAQAYVRDGVVEGEAPVLPAFNLVI